MSNQPISGDGLRRISAPAAEASSWAPRQTPSAGTPICSASRSSSTSARIHGSRSASRTFIPPPKTTTASKAPSGAGHRLAGARHPLHELVAVRVAALREQTAGAAAGMPDPQDSHRRRQSGRLQPLHEGQLLLFTGLLLAAGLAASLAAGRLRLPGLVLVLGLGMLIGSDGLGWIEFDDFELARSAGIVAVAMILFEGGLSSGFEEIRPVLRRR